MGQAGGAARLDAVDHHALAPHILGQARLGWRETRISSGLETGVDVLGGYVKEYAVHPDPSRLAAYGVGLVQLVEALEHANRIAGAGYVNRAGEAYIGGLWRAEGLLWHMGGRWELRLDVEAAGATQTLRQSVTLK